MALDPVLQTSQPIASAAQLGLNRPHTQLSLSPSQIKKMIDWIAELPELGRPLRGDRAAEVRRNLEHYAREYSQRPECRIYKRETWSPHSITDEGYYERAAVSAALIERIKTLR